MACSLWVLLLASCFSSGQQLGSVIRLQPFSQSRRDTFGLCKLYANERAAACCETPTALWDQAALTTSLMLSRQHRLIHMHQVESSLSVGVCSFYGLTSSPRTTAAVAAQSDAVRAKVVLLSWLQVVYLLCETWKQTKCANKSPEITRTGTECRVGCEHANSGSFFLFDTVHMKVSGWKHLSAFVCVGGVASPC